MLLNENNLGNAPPNACLPSYEMTKATLKDINYTSFPDMLGGREYMSEHQRAVVSELHRRMLQEPHMPAQVWSNGYVLAMVDYPGAANYVRCNRSGRAFSCRQPLFCPRCAGYESYKFLLKFISAFGRYRWYLVTLSFPPGAFSSENLSDLELRWATARKAMNRAYKAGFFDGCIYREEIVITTFLPITVRPHAHMIVCCENRVLDSEKLLALFHEEAMAVHLMGDGGEKVDQILDEKEFVRTTTYLFKAINLTKRYQIAWGINQRDVALARAPDQRWKINDDITDFVSGVGLLGEGQRRYVYKGVLHHKSANYAGLSRGQISHRKSALTRKIKALKTVSN